MHCIKFLQEEIMSLKNLTKLFLLILACCLMFYGYGYYKKYNTIARLEEKIKMGRYQDALSAIQQLENSLMFRILSKIRKEDPVIAYNNANLIATDMDFSTAAMQYAEVLKIDANDFQAKKNLERMRLGEQQFSTMFTPEQQEREDRIEALKLIPWGTKYKYSGEQKIRW